MGTIVYLSIRLACACYILYKVCGQKKKIREILLYAKLPPVKKKEPENVLSEPGGESGVMGSTRFVYLDEDAGKSVAPYMSQPLETAADFIGEEEDVAAEEVECKLPLEEMRMLKEEQEELDGTYPAVDAVSQAVTPDDLDNAGNVLFKLNDADKDEAWKRQVEAVQLLAEYAKKKGVTIFMETCKRFFPLRSRIRMSSTV